MKRSIIHYDHGTFVKGRQKLVGKPEFKKAAVHRSIILERCKDLIPHFSSNNAAALIFSATNPSEYLLAPRCIPVFPIVENGRKGGLKGGKIAGRGRPKKQESDGLA